MRSIKFILFVVCFLFSFNGRSQSLTDSLYRLIKKDKSDTNKVNHLNALGFAIMYQNPDTAIVLSKQALGIAEKLKSKKHIANAYNNLGVYNWVKGEFPASFSFHFRSLKIREQINDKAGTAMSLGNIGIVYWSQSETDKALKYLLRALKMYEQIQDKNGIAKNLGNIGVLYDQFNNLDTAILFYEKALIANRELGAKDREATQLGNLGVVYHKQANRADAESKNALQKKALEYYLQALELETLLGNTAQVARHKGNIGSLFIEQKQYGKAEKYLLEAISMYEGLNMINEKMQFEYALSELYSELGDPVKALEYYKAFDRDSDTLFNIEKNNEITKNELNYEFEKKEAALKADQDKKQAVAEADKKRQFLFIILLSSVALALTAITVVILRSLRSTKKQKAIIEEQKIIVEEKQKEVMDSIRYAKRIQLALLPTDKNIDKTMKELKKKTKDA